jgi:hypothetical protein
MKNPTIGRLRVRTWVVVGCVAGATIGLGSMAVAESSNDGRSGEPVTPASPNVQLVKSKAAERYPAAKDPQMAFMGDCLAARGARYDAETGNLYFGTGKPEELKAMSACTSDLVADRPLTQR